MGRVRASCRCSAKVRDQRLRHIARDAPNRRGRLLARGGVFVFDTNTLLTYRIAFFSSHSIICGCERFRWRGLGGASLRAGESTGCILARRADDLLLTKTVYVARIV